MTSDSSQQVYTKNNERKRKCLLGERHDYQAKSPQLAILKGKSKIVP
jgi:hypothetical protein